MSGFEVDLEGIRRQGRLKLSLPIGFDPATTHTANHNDRQKIRILHAALEYGTPNNPGSIAVGGVGSLVESLKVAQNQQQDILESRIVMPYYPRLHGVVQKFSKIGTVEHWFADKKVASIVYKHMQSADCVHYIIQADARYKHLFNNIQRPTDLYSDLYRSTFLQRAAYFCAAVAAFAMCGEPEFVAHIIQCHSWGLSFVGRLIAEYRKLYAKNGKLCSPYTLFTVHSAHSGDGIYEFSQLPDIGIARTQKIISLSNEIINGFDHLVYVSEQLLRESIMFSSHYSEHVLQRYLKGDTSAILNNIFADQFDPSLCLPEELRFNLNNISGGKFRLKEILNQQIFAAQHKKIIVNRPMTLYLGRLSEEKGIARLADAIEVVIHHGGTFVCMGIGSHPIITSIKRQYEPHENVIFIDSPQQQAKIGKLLRCAAEIYFVPSKMEACGLVPMEANLTGALVVASKVCGLINVVKPDANGMLFENDIDLRAMLTQAYHIWFELYECNDLNIVLQLIQESARKSYDWYSPTSGSVRSYSELYATIGIEHAILARFVRGETVLTLAIIARNRSKVQELLNEHKLLRQANYIGLTPLNLATRLNVSDVVAELRLQLQNKYVPGEKIVVLNMAFEYKQVKLGGVGEIVTALCESINRNQDRLNTEARIITPHYPWHDALLDDKVLPAINSSFNAQHMFNGVTTDSIISVVNNGGTIQYLVRPKPGQQLEWLFAPIAQNQHELIYDKITAKLAYFNSAVAGLLALQNDAAPKVHIVIGHSWGCGFVARIMREYYGQTMPKFIFIAHSEFSEQGVIPANHSDIRYMHSLGVKLKSNKDISPLIESAAAADHIVYVSQELEQQAYRHAGPYSVSGICNLRAAQGSASSIINNISNVFSPEKLTFELHDLVAAKRQAKDAINALIRQGNPVNSDEANCFANKYLDPNKILTICVSRFLHEKGINNLEAAIEEVLQQNGIFIVMGLYGGGTEDQLIIDLAIKYSNNPNVIILHEKTYIVQKKYGPLIRFAADLTLIPSHRESCGLVSMEAQLNASFVISSNVGGLNDTVRETETGFMYQNGKEGYIVRRRNYQEVRAAVIKAYNFIISLKEDRSVHNARLQGLYAYSKDNYLWDAPNSSLQAYNKLFLRLLLNQTPEYAVPATQHAVNVQGLDLQSMNIYAGLPSNFVASADGLTKMYSLPGYKHYLMSTSQGDIIAVFAHDSTTKAPVELGRSMISVIYLGQILHSPRFPKQVGKYVAVKKQNILDILAMQSFRREHNITDRLQCLSLPYIEVDTENPNYKYLFLELYAGKNLSKAIIRCELSILQKLQVAIEIINAVANMHQAGILHLDIHLENVMLEKLAASEYKIRLIDYGASKILPSGTEFVPVYACPQAAPAEMFLGQAGRKSDVYAIAVTIFEMYLLEFGKNIEWFRESSSQGEVTVDRKASFVANVKPQQALCELDQQYLQEIQRFLISMLHHDYDSRPDLGICKRFFANLLQKCVNNEAIEPIATTDSVVISDAADQISVLQFLQQHNFSLEDMNATNSVGHTPLTLLYKREQLYSITERAILTRKLLALGADINKTNAYGLAAMYFVTNPIVRDSELLDLLKLGAICAPIENDAYKLHEFLRSKGFGRFKGACFSPSGHTPLTYAVQHKDLRMIQLILAMDPDSLNRTTLYGNSAIHIALINKSYDILQFLLQQQPDIYRMNMSWQRPLDLQLDNSVLLQYMRAIVAKGAGTPIDKIRSAMERRDYNSIYAITCLHPELCKQLDPGAVVTLTNDNASLQYISTLYDLGFEITSYPDDLAAYVQLHNFLQQFAFVNSYRNLDMPNRAGHTPLTKAVELQDLRICKALLQYGAEVNAQNDFGNTALHLAVDIRSAMLIEFLLSHQADPNILNYAGFKPHGLMGLEWCDTIEATLLELQQHSSKMTLLG